MDSQIDRFWAESSIPLLLIFDDWAGSSTWIEARVISSDYFFLELWTGMFSCENFPFGYSEYECKSVIMDGFGFGWIEGSQISYGISWGLPRVVYSGQQNTSLIIATQVLSEALAMRVSLRISPRSYGALSRSCSILFLLGNADGQEISETRELRTHCCRRLSSDVFQKRKSLVFIFTPRLSLCHLNSITPESISTKIDFGLSMKWDYWRDLYFLILRNWFTYPSVNARLMGGFMIIQAGDLIILFEPLSIILGLTK